jgi:hypothetical protein
LLRDHVHDASKFTICINRAAVLFPCDVLAALDFPLMKEIQPIIKGNPIWLTTQTTIRDWLDVGCAMWRGPVMTTDAFRGMFKAIDVNFQSWVAAVAYAAFRCNASRIEVFGADWSGEIDAAGRAGTSREPARWEQEARKFGEVAAELAEKQIELVRM